MAASPTARMEASEPVMVRVPGGWFWMGCEIGRDDEKPVHRVWVDPFELAAYQVTNEEYACFLAAMNYPPPSCWNDPNFSHPNYTYSPKRNPQGPANSSRRASRGGSWRHHIKVARTAARSSIPPEFKYTDYGFRVGRSLIT